MTALMLTAVFLIPLAGGLLSLFCRRLSPRRLHVTVAAALLAEALLLTLLCLQKEASATLFSFRYRRDAEKEGAYPEGNFYAFFLLSQAALTGMDLAANVITMYFFFEMLTLLSMPMVLHDQTPEASAAALKYLFYSIAGAFLALGCLFILAGYTPSLSFTAGGYLTAQDGNPLLLTAVLLGIIGFGAKAGLYPLHAWLPAAHPVAPAPASAILSGIIAKAGLFGILRLLYFYVGTGLIRGTWVQTALLSLSLLTVFMGSMMAYREKLFKKRLAYSSVSQISYALFGLFLMTPDAVSGALMQVLFHAAVKICLFLTAGALITLTGRRYVDEYDGLGRLLPRTMGAFTLASLSLIGIPPFCGFISKWYLALGSLSSEVPVFFWLGPVILLVSALLTAGYLLPISIRAFFPGQNAASRPADAARSAACLNEGGVLLWGPVAVTAALSLLMGLCGQWIIPLFTSLAAPLC